MFNPPQRTQWMGYFLPNSFVLLAGLEPNLRIWFSGSSMEVVEKLRAHLARSRKTRKSFQIDCGQVPREVAGWFGSKVMGAVSWFSELLLPPEAQSFLHPPLRQAKQGLATFLHPHSRVVQGAWVLAAPRMQPRKPHPPSPEFVSLVRASFE